MTRRDLHTIEALYQTSTERAICVRAIEDGPDIWLPRSETTLAAVAALFGDAPPERGALVHLTAPEWLLTEKGLV